MNTETTYFCSECDKRYKQSKAAFKHLVNVHDGYGIVETLTLTLDGHKIIREEWR